MAGPTPQELIEKARVIEAEAIGWYHAANTHTGGYAQSVACRRLGDKSMDLAGAYRQAAAMLRV